MPCLNREKLVEDLKGTLVKDIRVVEKSDQTIMIEYIERNVTSRILVKVLLGDYDA